MQIHPLPQGAVSYFISCVTSGLHSDMVMGCFFPETTKTLTSQSLPNDEDFKRDHCATCIYNPAYNPPKDQLILNLPRKPDYFFGVFPLAAKINNLLEPIIGTEDAAIAFIIRKSISVIHEWETRKITISLDYAELDNYILDLLGSKGIGLDSINVLLSKIKSIKLAGYYESAQYVDYVSNELASRSEKQSCNTGIRVVRNGDCRAGGKSKFMETKTRELIIPPHLFVGKAKGVYQVFHARTPDLFPFLCGNVFTEGNVCWGSTKGEACYPSQFTDRYELFWQTPFNIDLHGTIDDVITDPEDPRLRDDRNKIPPILFNTFYDPTIGLCDMDSTGSAIAVLDLSPDEFHKAFGGLIPKSNVWFLVYKDDRRQKVMIDATKPVYISDKVSVKPTSMDIEDLVKVLSKK